MKRIKTLTMYLPQYYRTPENDEWWGEGFTDWTAVKAARPLFEGHREPKIPLGGNYYNLLEKQTMEKQAELMKKYGIDGQCIYHYYFKDGRKMLEKPAENLLKWADVDMPFCFCWANTSWIRTWKNDPWADKFRKADAGEEVLVEQKYGDVSDWEKHFLYLLPFFQDSRYIKIDNAPVFLIFIPFDIYCLEEMILYWKRCAVDNGFRDLYVILASDKPCYGADAILRHSPHSFYNLHRNSEKNVFTFDYDKLWDRIIEEPTHIGCRTYFEGLTNCDDTPRRGEKGIVLEGFSIKAFHDGMVRLYQKSMDLGNEFVFINAWNEWGEGMYLEPDEEYGYQMLEALKQAQEDAEKNPHQFEMPKSEAEQFGRQLAKAEAESWRYRRLYQCMVKWTQNREQRMNIGDYLCDREVRTVAIYGCGFMGMQVLNELTDSKVAVKYMIDQRRVHSGKDELKIVSPEGALEDVDAIIVTPFIEYRTIESKLKDKVTAKILSLEDMIYDM